MDWAPSRFNCRVLLVAVMLAGISVLAHAQQTTGASRARANAKAPTPGLYLVKGTGSDCPTLSWDAMFWPGGVLQIGRGEKLDASSRVLDSNRIQTSELNDEGKREAITYYRCDERVLPVDARYFDEPRKLTALPITPGYYRLRGEGGSPAQYFLFDTNRIAWMEDVAWDSQSNPTRRANVIRPLVDIRQVGPRVYTFTYRRWSSNAAAASDDNDFVPVLIEAPDRFSGWFVENGTIRYEPVDAKQIPAALRPHF
jgi:hypothetical protein